MSASRPPSKRQIEIVKMYDVTSDDYVLSFEQGGKIVLEIRAEDLTETATVDGRGIRICIGDVEMPFDWFRQTVNTYMPWLTGEER